MQTSYSMVVLSSRMLIFRLMPPLATLADLDICPFVIFSFLRINRFSSIYHTMYSRYSLHDCQFFRPKPDLSLLECHVLLVIEVYIVHAGQTGTVKVI